VEHLLGLLAAVALVFFGVDYLRRSETSRHSKASKELDRRERLEYVQRLEAQRQLQELEERVRARKKKEEDEPLETDSAESAADRLRREFGRE
jgi:hypothetical protein